MTKNNNLRVIGTYQTLKRVQICDECALEIDPIKMV